MATSYEKLEEKIDDMNKTIVDIRLNQAAMDTNMRALVTSVEKFDNWTRSLILKLFAAVMVVSVGSGVAGSSILSIFGFNTPANAATMESVEK